MAAVNSETRPVTIGAVAICYNEQRDLPGFLENLLPWVDEIVLVDDGSTDSTKQIALKAGEKVKFIESPRAPGEYYSDQRNKGIEQAESDWLLHMDVDERVPQALAKEIQQAIKDPSKDGYRYRRLNYFLHRPFPYGGWQHWNLVHLARRHLFHFGGKMHETCRLDAPPDRIGQLSGLMHHLNDASFAERLRKSIGYSSVEAETMLEQGKQIRWFHFLIRPIYFFLKSYFWERAFLAGSLGLLFSIYRMNSVFNWYAIAYDLQNTPQRNNLEKNLVLESPVEEK